MKRCLVLLLALIVLVPACGGGYQPAVTPSPPPPMPPSAPSSLTADAVSASQVELRWFDNSDNEEGFKLYRDNNVIATLPANTTAYEDTGLQAATTYRYMVKAYNSAGESGTLLCTIRTPNPPITVRLDRIGVYFDHDPFITGAGDIYLYIGVADGKGQPQTARIPPTSVIKLKDNETMGIGQQIFSTDCVGDELKLVAVAFESDALHGVVLGVIRAALSSYLGGGSGAAVSLITTLLKSQPSAEEGCPEGVTAETPEDDFVGAIEKIWTSAEYWGIGFYKDVHSGDLRLWFTIESPMEPLALTGTPSPPSPPSPSVEPTPPEIHELSLELSVSKGEEYDEYSFPIYLRNNQTLHLTWTVERGDKIWFVFLTPGGKYMGLKDNGMLEEGSCSQLQSGVIIFKPSEYGWGEGYYEMKPHMSMPGEAQVQVQYWIED